MFSDNLILCGDCDGTNSHLSLWRIPNDAQYTAGNVAPGVKLLSKKYLNEEHANFAEVCHLFMTEAKLVSQVPAACVITCAGPILKNTVEFTNLESGWKIDGRRLEKELGINKVSLINDFVGMGYGLLTLRPHECVVLNDAPKDETAPIAAIGADTGLGECFLTPGLDGEYTCFACEGGHTDFAPADEIEVELYNYLKAQLGCDKRFSVGRIVSGSGLATIYSFLAQKFPEKVDPKVHETFLKATTQQSKVISENVSTNELCNQTLEIFVSTYGREVGNAMLKYLPRGGFYITGDLAAKNPEYFTKKDIFLESVFDKGRVSPALRGCPIYLVLAEDLGERGAHYYAFQLLKDNQNEA